MRNNNKNFAFTLAEVLITLGIIGVVAAMTIPTLMNNVQDTTYKVAMKKEYSVLSQAFLLIQTDGEGSFSSAISGCTDYNNVCMKNFFKQKLSYIKECDDDGSSNSSNLNVCFPAQANIKNLNGTSATASYLANNDSAALVLKDGTALAFGADGSGTFNCNNTRGNAGYTNACGYIIVDVNGLKLPNTWGKDIYVFFVLDNQILPSSVNTVESYAATADDCGIGTNLGITCSSKYLSQ